MLGSRRPPATFTTREWFAGSPGRRLFAWSHPLLDRLLGLSTLESLYAALPMDSRPFAARALEALDVTWTLQTGSLDAIPRTGPLVIVANHPLGALDGLVVASAVGLVRADAKLLANELLARIPELADLLLPVDPFGSRRAVATNAAACRAAARWLQAGHALITFPAGEVAHVASGEGVADSPWSTGTARLILRTGAAVLPVFIGGRTSATFRCAGRLHPRARTALLARELLWQRRRRVTIAAGTPIAQARLGQLHDPERLTTYLRLRTQALAATAPTGATRARRTDTPTPAPLAAPERPDVLAEEIAALPAERVLLRQSECVVCVGTADELPHTLREIGRLREIAFRAAGEGTGRERDLDRFDLRYEHLFVWNAARAEVIGAYRIGPTDRLLPEDGLDGLYTSTLFRYDPRLLSEIGPALELGRAFVRTEYQRDYAPLLLLWKGVGAYVAARPRYRMLFGPVSISNTYHSLSKQILAAFLYANNYRTELAALVAPRNPPAFCRDDGAAPRIGGVVQKLADVASLLGEIEGDGKGVPVLLRQYLKLNGRLLGFNLDPAFGNALDGLMLVDLLDVDREILARYMGRAGAAAFLQYHEEAAARRAS